MKIIWEMDKGEECGKTHDILCLYNELSREKQLRIKHLYDDQVSVLNVEGRNRDGRSIRVGSLVNLQTLEEALASNRNTMTNYKYDGRFRVNSGVISGVIWNSNGIWTLPQNFVTFPENLLAFARDNLESDTA